MSPIDNHLRESLARHAADVDGGGERFAAVETRARALHRRRVAWVSGATAVVLAGGVVGGLAIAGSDRDTVTIDPGDDSTQTPAPTPTASPTPSPVPSLQTYGFLGWPAGRGEGTAAMDFADDVLWGGELPDGTFVLIRQASIAHEARAVAVVTPPQGDDYTITGGRLAENTREVSFVLPGGAYPWVLVIGEPTTGQIEYAADGSTYEPVETVDGWALFKRTGDENDRIRVLDGNGNLDYPLYEGKIDAGPNEPDA